MSEMIERVAHAITSAYSGLSIRDRRNIARAVIEIMREPTIQMQMIDAPDMPAGGCAADIWHDMIDVALEK